MISVITCCLNPTHHSIQELNIAKTIGTEHEYIVVDGSQDPPRYAAGYNGAAAGARGDILVFIDHDCYCMNVNWGAALEAKFAADPALGVAGVAGTQYLFADKYSWTAAGRPFVKGRIVYHLQNDDFFATVFSAEKGDAEVVACDGCFMAIQGDLFAKFGFDETTFIGAHFFDIDFCLQARSAARVIVTSDVTVKRRTQPVFGAHWREAGEVFLRKNKHLLPASCAPAAPDPAHIKPSAVIDLKDKATKTTIC